MKLTVSRIKQLIKEELEEFKGAKPVQTYAIEFSFMLDGTLHVFDTFDLKKVEIFFLDPHKVLTEEEAINAIATSLVPCQGVDSRGIPWSNGYYLNGEHAYNYFVNRLLKQVPEVRDIPVAHEDLAEVKRAYKEGKSRGYNPLSFTIRGGKYDGNSLQLKLTSANKRYLYGMDDEEPSNSDWDEDDPED